MTGRIEINCKLCKGCAYCVEACPKAVITMSGAMTDAGLLCAAPESPDKCNGCGLCAEVCPDIAITVWREG